MRVWRLFPLACVVLVAACGGSNGEPVRVTVPRGASVRVAAESLATRGVIANRTWFRLRARMAGLDRKLKPGLYEFPARVSTEEVLRRLAAGDAVHVRLTLPEGATLFDLARAVENRLGIPAAEFLAVARDSSLRQEFGIPGASVEGWLLPETFDFPALTTGREVLERFLTAHRDAWDSTWDDRARAAGLDRPALITLASIVEAEAKLPTDRPLIAAVYRNRMRIGMPLQADPGIQYGYLLRDGTRKSRMYHTDYAFDSPWNTYLHPGLPPGPIGTPSRAAIEAVLAPSPLPYLYFVAGADGAHRFSRTYQEHLRTIRTLRNEQQ
jgi:UPF0755 protein